MAKEYFVISVKHTMRHSRYMLLWAENDAGYRGKIESAGRYAEDRILSQLKYYNSGCDTVAVPCEVLERLAVPVEEKFFDTEGGKWVINSRKNWLEVLKHTICKPQHEPKPEYKGSRRKQEA